MSEIETLSAPTGFIQNNNFGINKPKDKELGKSKNDDGGDDKIKKTKESTIETKDKDKVKEKDKDKEKKDDKQFKIKDVKEDDKVIKITIFEEEKKSKFEISQEVDNFFNKQLINRGADTKNIKFSSLFPNAKKFLGLGSEKVVDKNVASFLQNNRDLVDLFNGNNKLLESLVSTNGKSQEHVKGVVVDFVFDNVNSNKFVTKDFLAKNPILTKFAALNLGEVSDLLNSSPFAGKAFTGDSSFVKEDIEDRIVDQAAALFPNDSKLTKQFFKENKLAAVFLLNKPGEVSSIRNDEINFARRASVLDSHIRNSVVESVFNQLDNESVFSKEFLNTNLDFTVAALGDSLTNDGNNLIEFVKENRDIAPVFGSVNFSNIFTSFAAKTASEKFPKDFPIDRNFLEQNPNISFLSNSFPSVPESLKDTKVKDKVETFVEQNKVKTESDFIKEIKERPVKELKEKAAAGIKTRSDVDFEINKQVKKSKIEIPNIDINRITADSISRQFEEENDLSSFPLFQSNSIFKGSNDFVKNVILPNFNISNNNKTGRNIDIFA